MHETRPTSSQRLSVKNNCSDWMSLGTLANCLSNPGSSSIVVEPLQQPGAILPGLRLGITLDDLWMASVMKCHASFREVGSCRSLVTARVEDKRKQGLKYRPSLMLTQVIYEQSTLPSLPPRKCHLHGFITCCFTFDQPLYVKTIRSVATSANGGCHSCQAERNSTCSCPSCLKQGVMSSADY